MATTVKFRHDVDVPLPHPDEMCVATFLGRAEITTEQEDGKQYLSVTITDLWLGVDIPTKFTQFDFRKVSTPGEKHWPGGFQSDLETAAIGAMHLPEAITLPDETSPLNLPPMRTSYFFERNEPLK